jgi:hypothetical protein
MAEEGDISDVLTNLSKPKTDATITLRIIKSFEFRTEKSLVLHGVNLDETTVGDLKARAKQGLFSPICRLLSLHCKSEPIAAIQTRPGWKPYRNAVLGA